MLKAMRHLVGALLVVGLLAGCGSSKSSSTTTGMTTPAKSSAQRAYEHRMAAIAPSLQSKILKLRFALEQARSPLVARAQLRHLDTRLDRAVQQLTSVQPPQDVAAGHARLIAAYRSLRAEFDRALQPLLRHRTTDAARVEAGRLAHAPAFTKIANALRAIIAKGYDIGFAPGS